MSYLLQLRYYMYYYCYHILKLYFLNSLLILTLKIVMLEYGDRNKKLWQLGADFNSTYFKIK